MPFAGLVTHQLTSNDCSACESTYQPVCDPTGRTHHNPCLARCSGQTSFTNGPCASINSASCTCPGEYVPVCGEDGVTYHNDCRARCAGLVRYQLGPCGLDTQCRLQPSCSDCLGVDGCAWVSTRGGFLCAVTPTSCPAGSTCTTSLAQCPASALCEFRSGCGPCAAAGCVWNPDLAANGGGLCRQTCEKSIGCVTKSSQCYADTISCSSLGSCEECTENGCEWGLQACVDRCETTPGTVCSKSPTQCAAIGLAPGTSCDDRKNCYDCTVLNGCSWVSTPSAQYCTSYCPVSSQCAFNSNMCTG